MTLQIFDTFEQGSAEWYAARMGIPTASEFVTVMREKGKAADGSSKTRTLYMRKLAGEIITGQPMESYSNGHMERGKIVEPEALEHYEFTREVKLRQVAFVRNGDKGCSPDALVGEDGGLEFKGASAHVQIERLEKGVLPPEHRVQVHGSIFVCGRAWWDFGSYCPGLPVFVVRVHRDEAVIRELAEAIDQFNEELATLVKRIRAYGKAA